MDFEPWNLISHGTPEPCKLSLNSSAPAGFCEGVSRGGLHGYSGSRDAIPKNRVAKWRFPEGNATPH